MRNHRLITLLSAAAITTASSLAVASPAHAEDAIVKLVSVESGKCLQPVNGSLIQGQAIVQEACNGSVAQQWTVTLVSATKVHLVNRSSGLCLDARGGATNGTPIQQWTCTFSHCVATPGLQDGLATELRFCDGDPAQLWNRPNG
jgi:hypothetical protein